MERWALVSILPETLRNYFEDVVVALIQRPVENRGKILQKMAGKPVRNEEIAQQEAEFVRNLVRNTIHPDLLRMVHNPKKVPIFAIDIEIQFDERGRIEGVPAGIDLVIPPNKPDP